MARLVGQADRDRLDAALPQLCELLRRPTFFDWSCQSLRIDPARARARLRLAKTEDALPSDIDWAAEIECARADGKIKLMAMATNGEHPTRNGGPDWKSPAWALEQLDRKHVGSQAKPEPDDEAEQGKTEVIVLPPAAILQAEIDKLRAENEALKAAKCT